MRSLGSLSDFTYRWLLHYKRFLLYFVLNGLTKLYRRNCLSIYLFSGPDLEAESPEDGGEVFGVAHGHVVQLQRALLQPVVI